MGSANSDSVGRYSGPHQGCAATPAQRDLAYWPPQPPTAAEAISGVEHGSGLRFWEVEMWSGGEHLGGFRWRVMGDGCGAEIMKTMCDGYRGDIGDAVRLRVTVLGGGDGERRGGFVWFQAAIPPGARARAPTTATIVAPFSRFSLPLPPLSPVTTTTPRPDPPQARTRAAWVGSGGQRGLIRHAACRRGVGEVGGAGWERGRRMAWVGRGREGGRAAVGAREEREVRCGGCGGWAENSGRAARVERFLELTRAGACE